MQIKKPINISAVSYANTFPFLYGLESKMDFSDVNLSKDVPSKCADKLISGEVDLGLIPVAKISEVPNAHIISDFCIGSIGAVKTVLLMSKHPLDQITEVFLDNESATSVRLVKVLAKSHWKKNWAWKQAPKVFPVAEIHQSIVLIGDKTEAYRADYPFVYDLSQAWFEFTGLPFVFAAWVANKELPDHFIRNFNDALSYGLNNIEASIDVYANESQKSTLIEYLNNFISYPLNSDKKKGMELFLKYIQDLS